MAVSEFSLPEIPYLKLKFNLIAREDCHLASYKGFLLHSAFGNALRRTVCVMPRTQLCQDCFLNRQCINTKIFETFIFDKPPRFLKGLKTSPRPFVLYCADETREFKKDENFSFEITLIGQVTEQFPFVIYAVLKMAEMGLGGQRYKFKLEEVFYQDGHWQKLFDGTIQILLITPITSFTPGNHSHENMNTDELIIRFITPTRLKFNEKLGKNFTFRQLLFKMIRRISELAYFYVPTAQNDWEFRDILDRASKVQISNRQLYWVDLTRYSARQKTEMQMGGFEGLISLKGEWTSFMSILKTSELLHVGKGTTFGLGKINIC